MNFATGEIVEYRSTTGDNVFRCTILSHIGGSCLVAIAEVYKTDSADWWVTGREFTTFQTKLDRISPLILLAEAAHP